MEKVVLGIDIGGTNLKVGRVVGGRIEAEKFKGVQADATMEEVLEDLYTIIDSVINLDVKSIGIGVPAIVDPVSGIVYDVQNIPSWKVVPLKELLEQRYQLEVYINNDANCFALGEKIFGKGSAYTNFVGVSIGTGIGAGIIINNAIYNGVLCGAGEIGMLPYKDGIYEDYASSFYFANTYNQSARELSTKASKGDAIALKAFDEFGLHLGAMLKAVLYMYAPEAIILGGSISKSFPLFKKAMELSLSSFAFEKQIEHLKIEVSNQEGIAILGAASLCY